MANYRRRRSSDTWHWKPNCSNYPTKNSLSKGTKPKSGELCNECKAKSKK